MDVGPEVAGIPDASEIGERMTNRATEIDLIQDAEQRHEGYAREWLADPEFKAAVHRYDRAQAGTHATTTKEGWGGWCCQIPYGFFSATGRTTCPEQAGLTGEAP